MIELQNVEVCFNRGTPIETRALRGLSLLVRKGEFVTVIGTNGAGKSTLLNVLSGETTPHSGSVKIDGADVTGAPTHRRATSVSRVFQDPLAGTCANLTVLENLAIAYGRNRRRGLRSAMSSTLRKLATERLAEVGLGLEKRLDDRIGLLSGGQRQVISLVMATLHPVTLLLLDEHTAALDPRTAELVMDLTKSVISEHGLTALMVTHSMRQALDFGDRTVMLHEGQVALDICGTARECVDVPHLLKMFEKVRGEQVVDDALLLG
jgi:putative tryptophan/tyrosine transport system ATP-binding protein